MRPPLTAADGRPVARSACGLRVPWSEAPVGGGRYRRPPQAQGDAMTKPDATMTRIGKGIELNQHGEREAARAVFAQVWSDIGGGGGGPPPPSWRPPPMSGAPDGSEQQAGVWLGCARG